MQTVRSFCRICTSVCGILVDVEGDQIIRVHGDHDHPFSQGYTCPKGRATGRLPRGRTCRRGGLCNRGDSLVVAMGAERPLEGDTRRA